MKAVVVRMQRVEYDYTADQSGAGPPHSKELPLSFTKLYTEITDSLQQKKPKARIRVCIRSGLMDNLSA